MPVYRVQYQDGDTHQSVDVDAETFKVDPNGLILIGEGVSSPRQRPIAAFREWSAITEAVDEEPAEDEEPEETEPDVVLFRGIDYADAIRDLVHLVYPNDTVDIAATGKQLPELEYSDGTDWIAEAKDIAAEVLGKKLHRLGTTWILVPLRGDS